MKHIKLLLVMSVCTMVLTGCMSTRHVLGYDEKDIDYEKASGGGRYTILQDHGPSDDVKVDHLPDLIPKWEAKSRGGNKSPYEVWGKKYWVMDSAKGYSAEGTASWYGKKFHGHKTSNGEIYDMYAFSAAHKSLPLPTYLKVTNLDNGRSVIVRVNDRGPFHGDRLIDLSYAAAVRLDYHKKGLARVRVEAITPEKGQAYSSAEDVDTTPQALPDKASAVSQGADDKSPEVIFTHLQLGAFSSQASAEKLKQRLFEAFDTDIRVEVNQQGDGLYKVLVGPYKEADELQKWQGKLLESGFGDSVRVALLP